ncbi:MAG TPA: tetratricopeptide repeat protein, partial [Candidatus Binatia bacterium]|nr:tetratricopeptide repeat protein [Candidatus Binatia bacterium]
AITNYLATVAIKPDFAQAHYNIGNARLSQGRLDEAIKYLSNAVRIDDGYARAHSQMGTALQQSGKNAEAMKHFERAIALDPGDVSARAQLAGLFAATGQTEAAINQSREALKVTPDAVLILNNLAWMLATTPEAKLRNGAEAVRLAERAVELSQRKEVFFLGTLAAAYAEAGRFEDAIKTAEEAVALAEKNGPTPLVSKNRELLAVYREHRAWREPVRAQ